MNTHTLVHGNECSHWLVPHDTHLPSDMLLMSCMEDAIFCFLSCHASSAGFEKFFNLKTFRSLELLPHMSAREASFQMFLHGLRVLKRGVPKTLAFAFG